MTLHEVIESLQTIEKTYGGGCIVETMSPMRRWVPVGYTFTYYDLGPDHPPCVRMLPFDAVRSSTVENGK